MTVRWVFRLKNTIKALPWSPKLPHLNHIELILAHDMRQRSAYDECSKNCRGTLRSILKVMRKMFFYNINLCIHIYVKNKSTINGIGEEWATFFFLTIMIFTLIFVRCKTVLVYMVPTGMANKPIL